MRRKLNISGSIDRIAKCLIFTSVFGCFLSVKGDTDTLVTIYEPVSVAQFEGYHSVWFLQYHIPEDTVFANFSFLTERNHDDCAPIKIYVHLQPGGYPVLAPRNESFPKDFFLDGSALYNLSLSGNESFIYKTISNPVTGNWFAMTYSLTQKDLVIKELNDKSCSYSLSSNLTTKSLPDVKELTVGSAPFAETILLQQNTTKYRFYINDRTWKYTLKLDGCKLNKSSTVISKCPVKILTRSKGIPGNESTDNMIDCSTVPHKHCYLQVLRPLADESQYISFVTNSSVVVGFYLSIVIHECGTSSQFDLTPCPVITHMYRIGEVGQDFRVTYALRPTRLEFVENVVKVYGRKSRIFQIPVYPFQDSGGTLRFKAVFNDTHFKNSTEVNVTICISRSVIPVQGAQLVCDSMAPMTLTSLQNDSAIVSRHYPYPRTGTWFVAMQATCFKSENGSNLEQNQCQDFEEDILVKFDLGLLPCYDGSCASNGVCLQYFSGVVVYSSCECHAEWRGYGCTDDTDVKPQNIQLLYSLLLSLSNLFFLPAVVVAVHRRCYTEAVIYFCTMFFSTFYHACDMSPWSTYLICIMPYHVLSKLDFFCSIMSIWVTLMAVVQLRQPFYSISHMLGAVGLSMGVEWQQHGFIPYIVPICLGLALIGVTWFYKSRKKKHCYPGLRQVIFMVPGVAAAIVGICIYSLLETDSNYPYTHSIWHIAMATSIVFLLPKQQPAPTFFFSDTSNDSDDTSLLDIASGPSETVNLQSAEDTSPVLALVTAMDKDDVVLLD